MLGFLKKFRKSKGDKDAAPQKKADEKAAGKDKDTEKGKSKKKIKKLPLKLIIIILLIIVAVAASGFVVYFFYFKGNSAENQKPAYQKVELKHLELPEEMIKFTFDYLPDLYQSLLVYNSQIELLNAEIKRIESIGMEYPEQKKIADKEKKNWEKTKAGLEKTFLKVQKPVKETYVLFRVNKELGLAQIEAKAQDLSGVANDALEPVKTMTEKLKIKEEVPQGMIQGTLYKLKKKFL